VFSPATRLPSPPLAAVCRWDDGQATVSVSGEVDFATAGILARCPDEVTRRAPRRLVIDLAATSFLDAAGLRVTARARKALPAGFPVALRAPARQVRLAREFGGLARSASSRHPGWTE